MKFRERGLRLLLSFLIFCLQLGGEALLEAKTIPKDLMPIGILVHPDDGPSIIFNVSGHNNEKTQIIDLFLQLYGILKVFTGKLWVNLNYGVNGKQVLSKGLAFVDVGYYMLLADLKLKCDTQQLLLSAFSNFDVNVSDFSEVRLRVWLSPEDVEFTEFDDALMIRNAFLDVNIELIGDKNNILSSILKQYVIPRLRRKVNYSPDYLNLRQIYYLFIISHWLKQKFPLSRLVAELFYHYGCFVSMKWNLSEVVGRYLSSYMCGKTPIGGIFLELDRLKQKTFFSKVKYSPKYIKEKFLLKMKHIFTPRFVIFSVMLFSMYTFGMLTANAGYLPLEIQHVRGIKITQNNIAKAKSFMSQIKPLIVESKNLKKLPFSIHWDGRQKVIEINDIKEFVLLLYHPFYGPPLERLLEGAQISSEEEISFDFISWLGRILPKDVLCGMKTEPIVEAIVLNSPRFFDLLRGSLEKNDRKKFWQILGMLSRLRSKQQVFDILQRVLPPERFSYIVNIVDSDRRMNMLKTNLSEELVRDIFYYYLYVSPEELFDLCASIIDNYNVGKIQTLREIEAVLVKEFPQVKKFVDVKNPYATYLWMYSVTHLVGIDKSSLEWGAYIEEILNKNVVDVLSSLPKEEKLFFIQNLFLATTNWNEEILVSKLLRRLFPYIDAKMDIIRELWDLTSFTLGDNLKENLEILKEWESASGDWVKRLRIADKWYRKAIIDAERYVVSPVLGVLHFGDDSPYTRLVQAMCLSERLGGYFDDSLIEFVGGDIGIGDGIGEGFTTIASEIKAAKILQVDFSLLGKVLADENYPFTYFALEPYSLLRLYTSKIFQSAFKDEDKEIQFFLLNSVVKNLINSHLTSGDYHYIGPVLGQWKVFSKEEVQKAIDDVKAKWERFRKKAMPIPNGEGRVLILAGFNYWKHNSAIVSKVKEIFDLEDIVVVFNKDDFLKEIGDSSSPLYIIVDSHGEFELDRYNGRNLRDVTYLFTETSGEKIFSWELSNAFKRYKENGGDLSQVLVVSGNCYPIFWEGVIKSISNFSDNSPLILTGALPTATQSGLSEEYADSTGYFRNFFLLTFEAYLQYLREKGISCPTVENFVRYIVDVNLDVIPTIYFGWEKGNSGRFLPIFLSLGLPSSVVSFKSFLIKKRVKKKLEYFLTEMEDECWKIGHKSLFVDFLSAHLDEIIHLVASEEAQGDVYWDEVSRLVQDIDSASILPSRVYLSIIAQALRSDLEKFFYIARENVMKNLSVENNSNQGKGGILF